MARLLSGSGTISGLAHTAGATLSAINALGITTLGTVTAGTLGSAVVLNHDAETNAWHRYAGSTVNQTSAAVLDYDGNIFTGDDIAEAGGVITVTNAGLYWIGYSVSSAAVSGHNWDIRIEETLLAGTAAYQSVGAGLHYYSGETITVVVRLAAGEEIDIYGTGHYYGETGTDAMTVFSGCRIGA